jgi:hypothetical protein
MPLLKGLQRLLDVYLMKTKGLDAYDDWDNNCSDEKEI